MFRNFKRVLSVVMVLAMVLASVAILASCGGGETVYPGAGEYTYNTFLSVFPTVWNNHTYQTATDGEILGYTEPGFYTFDYNETKDGYVLVPEMATQDPIDVTADYVGEDWGIAEGETARAWKIVLRDNIKWEDGTPITAHDFVTSAQLLLDPVANNYRADTMWTGNMVITNAKNYFYGGKDIVEDNGATEAFGLADLVKGADGVYTQANGKGVYISVVNGIEWCSGNSLKDYVDAYGATYFGMDHWEELLALTDEETGYIAVTDESLDLLESVIATNPAWGETRENVVCYMFYDSTYPVLEFNKVGIQAVSDTELVLIMDRPLSGFYLLYSLTGAWLVNEELYKANTKIEDGVYYNTYGTSAETYMSYGPYKLSSFQLDKQMILERNEYWYGYSDPANEGLYQTTKIVYDKIDNPTTAMELFLQGKLDAKGLDVDTIAEYAGSDHVYYTDGASTFFIALNPDLEALTSMQEKAGENINKTILTVKEFRMALSFALDRAAFNLACDPTASSGFAVYNNLIISDPETGTSYRSTEQAKKVLAEFWGLTDEIGEGKLYPTIDDAIASITGYNKAMAQDYFNQAYDIAIANNLMDADDVIQICVGIPSQHTFYSNGYDFLVNCYTDAVKGTKLEGKITFTKDDTVGNGFADALRNNTVDLLFGVGWTGSALDPYYLMTAYTQESYQYDPAWNTSEATLDIEVDGVVYTASVWDWTLAMQGEVIMITDAEGNTQEFSCGLNDGKPELRLELLAALEGAILSNYDLLPINNESSAALKGMQINYYTEEYVYGVGRGGIKYMTYNYDDSQWSKFVADNNGILNYK